MVKEQDFEAKKIKINVKNPTSNIGSISYGQFPARNGSKTTITQIESTSDNC